MPFLMLDEVRLHYELSGKAGAPVLLFSNSLGTNLGMWEAQRAALDKQFRILRYDKRGHGQSSVPPPPYKVEQLGCDVLGLLDGLRIDRVHFCGLSIGGLTGMWLGIHAPQRLHKLVLCNTGARIGTVEMWNARIESVRQGGTKSLAPAVVERFFSPEFRARCPQAVSTAQAVLREISTEGYIGCCSALRDADLRDRISSIHVPTLVIAGSKDNATPPALGQELRDHIPGAKYVELPAAHLSNIEAAAEFNAALSEFLSA
ncbi:MAG TPA: 3-oxoadipate enol-lactonase [Terriglobales bacterium]|nr:3-oxoadipate enol-lactonase [Terriglobales bacterium]